MDTHEKNSAIIVHTNQGKPTDIVAKYSSIGSYPIFYVSKDSAPMCGQCIQDNLDQCIDPDNPSWYVVAHDCNWEDPHLYCEHCGERIESAYADDDNDENT